MKKGGKVLLYTSMGCGTLIMGSCLVLGALAHFIDVPQKTVDPAFWLTAPGETYRAWDYCVGEWEHDGGLLSPRHCAELLEPPGLLPGPASASIWYEMVQGSRVVDVVELRYGEVPFTRAEAEERVVAGLSEVVEWELCEPDFVPYMATSQWGCGEFTYAYILVEGEGEAVFATIWISRPGARPNVGMMDTAAAIHREAAAQSLARGRQAVEEERPANADWHFMDAYFFLTQIPGWRRTSEDEALVEQIPAMRRALHPQLREDRAARGIGPPLPSFGEAVSLLSLVDRPLRELEPLFATANSSCTQSLTGGPSTCSFQGSTWVVEAKEDGHSYAVAVLLHMEIPPVDEIPHLFGLPAIPPDVSGPSAEEEGVEVLRWEGSWGLEWAEVRFSREHGVVVAEAHAVRRL